MITNGPQDTTVCMNAMVECYCGFTGATPNFVSTKLEDNL